MTVAMKHHEDYLAYQRKYYKKNRPEILKKKREKYDKDKDYREGCLHRSSLRRALTSDAVQEARTVVVHAARKEKVYSIRQAAPMVNRSYDVLKKWRQQGDKILPKALYKTPQGWDLYSESQVMYLAALLKIADAGGIRLDYRDMGHILDLLWKKRFVNHALPRAIKEVRHGEKYKRKRAKEDRARNKEKSKARRATLRKIYGQA